MLFKNQRSFTVALFTIAKIWNKSRCPLTIEWIKTMWYTYTIDYFSAIKTNEILSFAAKWDGTEGHYVKGNKPGTERQVIHILSHR